MKTFINVSIPLVITISLVLLLNAGSSNIYGQIISQTNQTNQTSGQNITQQGSTTARASCNATTCTSQSNTATSI